MHSTHRGYESLKTSFLSKGRPFTSSTRSPGTAFLWTRSRSLLASCSTLSCRKILRYGVAPFFGRIHVCFFALLAKYCHSGFGMLAQVLLGPSFFKWCFQALLSDERVGIRLLNSKTDDRLTDKDAVRKLLMEENPAPVEMYKNFAIIKGGSPYQLVQLPSWFYMSFLPNFRSDLDHVWDDLRRSFTGVPGWILVLAA